MDPNAPDLFLATGCRALDVRRGLHIPTQTDGVFLVIDDVEVDGEGGQSARQRRDSTGADTGDGMLDAVDFDDAREATLEVLRVGRLAWFRWGGGS